MKKGFTLIELMIVIGIIALLSAIILPRFSGTTDSAKVARVQGDLANLRTAINMFHVKEEAYPELEENLELVEGKEFKFTDFYSKSKMPETPAFEGGSDLRQVVDKRDDTGGWLYLKENGEIYANLKNGNYTLDTENEIWNGEEINGETGNPGGDKNTYDSALDRVINGETDKDYYNLEFNENGELGYWITDSNGNLYFSKRTEGKTTVSWINDKNDIHQPVINIVNPSDKAKTYTVTDPNGKSVEYTVEPYQGIVFEVDERKHGYVISDGEGFNKKI